MLPLRLCTVVHSRLDIIKKLNAGYINLRLMWIADHLRTDGTTVLNEVIW